MHINTAVGVSSLVACACLKTYFFFFFLSYTNILSLLPIAIWYTGYDTSNASPEVKRLSKCFSGNPEKSSACLR